MVERPDLVVRGAAVADGTGGPCIEADVAVSGGIIIAVGKVIDAGREEIDARGLLLTPGFVDIHTHYDGQAVWDSRLASSSWHGVTTAVMGNCGVGFAPVRAEDRERLVELMEGVEDIPGVVLDEGLDWDWSSFADYMAVLDRRPHDMDICAQLAHAPLRLFVMGERATRLEPATGDDVARMREIARQAMEAGALGFSTSRTLNHRTSQGGPIFGLRAGEDELMGIALGMRDAGRGAIEFISDWDTPDFDTEFGMVRRVVERSGRPLSLTLGQRHTTPDAWRTLLHHITRAANDGVPIKGQVAPRPIGVLMGLQGTRNPFSDHPSYKAIAHRPLADRLAIMQQPDFRVRLLAEDRIDGSDPIARRIASFEMIFPLGNPPNYAPRRDQSIAAEAARQGRSAAEVAYDLLIADGGRDFLLAPLANYHGYSLDVCREMLADANTLVGVGDGGAHVGFISDASFPTFVMAYWGRDRGNDRFAIPWLVKRLTADNALAVHLFDRGVIAPGMKADLNVIDFDRLSIQRPLMVADLPAGGSRLLQQATGYAATVVSGVVTYREGKATGRLPGGIVRGPQARPRDRPSEMG